MKKLIILLTLAVLLLPLSVFAGEIVFGWNKVNEAGGIQDMKFMPDESQFIVLAGLGDSGVLQIRNSENGEQTNSFPVSIGSFAKFDFTPDSSRIILTNSKSGQLALYNLADMSLLKFFLLKDTIALWFTNIAIDPVKPYVYVTAYGEKTQPYYLKRGQVSVYNYETMELVKHLTPFDDTEYSCLSVSKDGKYLAAISTGISYLKVWDLNTMQQIRNFQLYDQNIYPPSDSWCEPKDIKFSEKNTENIYFTGSFPNETAVPNDGLFIYQIKENKIIYDKFHDIIIGDIGGKFQLFDNEERIITVGMSIKVLNIRLKTIELSSGVGLQKPFVHNIIYSLSNDKFIGNYKEYFSSGKYDRSTSIVKENPNIKEVIFPNPTTEKVNIQISCQDINSCYEVYDINGVLILKSMVKPNVNSITLSFSKYPAGIYFLNLTCGKSVSHYKIIKEK